MTKINARIMSADKKTVVREISIDYPMPRNYAEACRMWGESVAWGLLEDQAIVRIQAKMRGFAFDEKKKPRSNAEIQQHVVKAKMVTREQTRDPVARARKQIDNIFASPNMSAEQHAAIVAMLRDAKPGLVKQPAKK